MSPASRTRPITAWRVVRLPAPSGPIRPTISPRRPRGASRGPRARRRTALEALDLEHRLSHGVASPPRVAQVGGGDVEGAPDLHRRPGGEYPALVEDVDPVADRPLPAPCCGRSGGRRRRSRRGPSVRRPRTPVPPPPVTPPRARRAHERRGLVASARATPSRRSSPCGSFAAGRSASGVRPSSSSSRAARRRASRGPRARRAPQPRRSPARRGRGTSGCAGRCGRARTAPAVGAPRCHGPEVDPAGCREVEAADHVDERRLSRAVRADQPHDLVPVKLERDLRERLTPAKDPRDGGGPERVSGPRSCRRVPRRDLA